MSFACDRCGKTFPKHQGLKTHLARRTPCNPIIDAPEPAEHKQKANVCRFCGRTFSAPWCVQRHIAKSCKIVPREGNSNGMERLYEHLLRKQEEKYNSAVALQAEPNAGSGKNEVGADGLTPSGSFAVTVNGQIMNHCTQTVNNITLAPSMHINVFGKEDLSKITKQQIFDILRDAGKLNADNTNIRPICERAILKAAMLVYSDPANPENITCYLPKKRGEKNALIHGESGWEVHPVALVLTPMAARGMDAIFEKQPSTADDNPTIVERWVADECCRILRYLDKHEGDLLELSHLAEGMKGILIRNRDLLERTLATLPMAGYETPQLKHPKGAALMLPLGPPGASSSGPPGTLPAYMPPLGRTKTARAHAPAPAVVTRSARAVSKRKTASNTVISDAIASESASGVASTGDHSSSSSSSSGDA